MTTERLLGLAMMNIHYEKPIDYDAVVRFYVRKDTEECFLLIPCSTKHKIENSEINAVYFYHSFTNANLHSCFTAFSDILTQKEWHFHFKK